MAATTELGTAGRGEAEYSIVRQVFEHALADTRAVASVPMRLIESARQEPGRWGKITPVGVGLYFASTPIMLACYAISNGASVSTAVASGITAMGIQCGLAGVCLEMEQQSQAASPVAS